MSFDVDWDVNNYRDDHESEDHWQLRRAFMEKWKNDYPQERLVCLARVFTNVELLGCKYPSEVMQEISTLSYEVAQPYRQLKKNMLQRTFVSASDAAEDRAKGIKRKGGIIIEEPKTKIQFVSANNNQHNDDLAHNITNSNDQTNIYSSSTINDKNIANSVDITKDNANLQNVSDPYNYMMDMSKLQCLNVQGFKEYMFGTAFGKFVLLIRPWATKLTNIQASCQVCNVTFNPVFENRCFTLSVNGQMVAQATGDNKAEARTIVEKMAWERLHQEVVCVLVKEAFIPQNDTRISVTDVSKNRSDVFGKPVENSVAMKMMKMMGWKGGGLGVDSQGIAEPIKPNLQLVNRAGLGSQTTNSQQLRKAAFSLMRRYISSETLDVDLVFSSDFSKEERALLHQCAQRVGLGSKSYGTDSDRFLVVKKKLDPFSLVRAVIDKGGITPKYQVFIPAKLAHRS